jgi:hypothetical protein
MYACITIPVYEVVLKSEDTYFFAIVDNEWTEEQSIAMWPWMPEANSLSVSIKHHLQHILGAYMLAK